MPRCTVIDTAGTVLWSNDPNLISVVRLGRGRYRVRFDRNVTNDALFGQPLAPHPDGPRSLLAWMELDGPTDVHVGIDAHRPAGGTGSAHAHREDLDLRFSLMRCERPG